MSAQIGREHPLRELFSALVEQAWRCDAALAEPPLPEYVANLLVRFTHRDELFCIRNAEGRPLEQVGEMLLEGDITLNATSFEREREVHKHIGDVTLFWTGVYPEMLRQLRHATRPDHLVEYVEQGRRSYRIASTFDYGRFADEAPVLRRLSESFERCVWGLHEVRRQLDTMATPEARRVQRLLES